MRSFSRARSARPALRKGAIRAMKGTCQGHGHPGARSRPAACSSRSGSRREPLASRPPPALRLQGSACGATRPPRSPGSTAELDQQGRGRGHRRRRPPGHPPCERRRLRHAGRARTPGRLPQRGPARPFQDVTDEVFGEARSSRGSSRPGTSPATTSSTCSWARPTRRRAGSFEGWATAYFEDVTELLLPQGALSVGDLEVG